MCRDSLQLKPIVREIRDQKQEKFQHGSNDSVDFADDRPRNTGSLGTNRPADSRHRAALDAHKDHVGRALPVNVGGAIAAICARISGLRTSHAIFVISRLPNLIAHTREERTRPVADTADRFDPKDHDYNSGAGLPEGWK